MSNIYRRPAPPETRDDGIRRGLWPASAVLLLLIVFGLWTRLSPAGANATHPPGHSQTSPAFSTIQAGSPGGATPAWRQSRAKSPATPEQIVAGKLRQFAVSRRNLAHALAERHGLTVSDDVERFFAAVEAGNWDEIKTRYNAINSGDGSASTKSGRPPDIEKLWPAIVDAYGAAEQVHLWPAQQLLDYGNSVMDSLRPGMVYVGGTDNGRWIPELMNETSGGTPHMVVTQNGLADPGYLDYVNLQYGSQMTTLNADDALQARQSYLADYQARLTHDQQFPDEPPQIRPGEGDGIHLGADGQLEIGGPNARIAVMAINERLLTSMMDQNPGLSFALQESFPLKSTYADAAPLGPLMELRAPNGPAAFSADVAAQSQDYWSARTGQLLADPAIGESTDTLRAYAKDAAAAANLLAAHDYNSEAEQVYRSALQLNPGSYDAVAGYLNLLTTQSRLPEAIAVGESALQANPGNQALQNLFNRTKGLRSP